MITIRKEMPNPQLGKDEFKRRYRARFYDPAFAPMQAEIGRLAEIAWDGYDNSRKAPSTRPAGSGFADPDYQLPIEWKLDRGQECPNARRHWSLTAGIIHAISPGECFR